MLSCRISSIIETRDPERHSHHLQGESRLVSMHHLSIRDTTAVTLASVSGDRDTYKTLKDKSTAGGETAFLK